MGDLNNGVSPFSIVPALPSNVPNNNATGSVEEAAGSASVSNCPARRPRGRPLGSKNKPKPQTIVELDSTNVLRGQMFMVEGGADVKAAIVGFVRRRKVGVSVLYACGNIAAAEVRHRQGVICLSGDIVSLSGTVIPATETAPSGCFDMTVHVAVGQGRVAFGNVSEKMVAGGPVLIVVAFRNFPLDRPALPEVDEQDAAPEQTAGRNYGGSGVSPFDLEAHLGGPLLPRRQDMLGGGAWDSGPSRPRRPHPY